MDQNFSKKISNIPEDKFLTGNNFAKISDVIYSEAIDINETSFEIKDLHGSEKYELYLGLISADDIENINDDTILCRCEDITKKDIKNAVSNGAKNLNQIKSWTRFGMGPCQGRTCQYSVAKIASEHLRCNIEDLGYLTGRTPLRPFPLDKAIGDFEYEEITKVEAAPL